MPDTDNEKFGKAAQQAMKRGLKHAQFGQWADPTTGKIVAYTRGDDLIDVGSEDGDSIDQTAVRSSDKPTKSLMGTPSKPFVSRNQWGYASNESRHDPDFDGFTTERLLKVSDSLRDKALSGNLTAYSVISSVLEGFGRTQTVPILNPSRQQAQMLGLSNKQYNETINGFKSGVLLGCYWPSTDAMAIKYQFTRPDLDFSKYESMGHVIADTAAYKTIIHESVHASDPLMSNGDTLEATRLKSTKGGTTVNEGLTEYISRKIAKHSLYNINGEFTEEHEGAFTSYPYETEAARVREEYRKFMDLPVEEGALGAYSKTTSGERLDHVIKLSEKALFYAIDDGIEEVASQLEDPDVQDFLWNVKYDIGEAGDTQSDELRKYAALRFAEGYAGHKLEDFFDKIMGIDDKPLNFDDIISYQLFINQSRLALAEEKEEEEAERIKRKQALDNQPMW